MATKRNRKPRPTYRRRSEAEYRETIKAAIPFGGPFMDFLNEVGQERVEGQNEFERGVCEGRRRFAGELVGIALSDESTMSENS